VLSLDSDMLPLGGGIERLLAADLHGRALGAVRDNTQWRSPGRRAAEFREAGLPARPYLNAGCLLIDVERFNAEGLLERSVALLGEGGRLPYVDQLLLNLLLRGEWTEISPAWNWQFTWSTRFFASIAQPRILHFIGPRKPWADTRGELPPSVRAVYRDFQRRCYPDRPELSLGDPDAACWPARPVRTFLRHAMGAEATRRYLLRFPSPWTTRPAGE
jgi:lipopolysaccharide biosynthesis glycosyltransferase